MQRDSQAEEKARRCARSAAFTIPDSMFGRACVEFFHAMNAREREHLATLDRLRIVSEELVVALVALKLTQRKLRRLEPRKAKAKAKTKKRGARRA